MKWWAIHGPFNKMKWAKVGNTSLRRWSLGDFRVHDLSNCPSNSSKNWIDDLGHISFLPAVSAFAFVIWERWMILKFLLTYFFFISKSLPYIFKIFFQPPQAFVVQPACVAGTESRHLRHCGQCDLGISWALTSSHFVGGTVTYHSSWPQEIMSWECFHNQTHSKAIKSKWSDKALYYFCQGCGQWVNPSCSVAIKNE